IALVELLGDFAAGECAAAAQHLECMVQYALAEVAAGAGETRERGLTANPFLRRLLIRTRCRRRRRMARLDGWALRWIRGGACVGPGVLLGAGGSWRVCAGVRARSRTVWWRSAGLDAAPLGSTLAVSVVGCSAGGVE